MRQLKYCRYDEKKKVLVSQEEPAKFDEPCFSTFLLKCFNKHGDRPSLTDSTTDVTLTFNDVRETSLKIASSFVRRLSLEVGDVVFGYCFTSAMYACTMYACIFTGVVFTGEPARLSPVSLVPQINNCKCKVALCVLESLPRLLQALEQCPLVRTIVVLDSTYEDIKKIDQVSLGGRELIPLQELIESGDASDECLPRTNNLHSRDQLVFLPYSSGTTGLPKGVMRRAHSLIAQAYNLQDVPIVLGDSNDRVSLFQSLGHVSGQSSLIFYALIGTHLVILPELDLDCLLAAIDKYELTVTFFPPTIIQMLAKKEFTEGRNLSSLKIVMTGGAPLAPSVVASFTSKLPNMKKLTNTYALSESHAGTYTPEDCFDYRSVGSLFRGVELKVVDRESGAACSFNESGEIYLRSEMNASGYLKRPEAQAETWTDDGWVRTGDAGYYDEQGLVFLIDRYKEMIKVHINQVAPAELQDLLCRHPQVSEACVVATSHPVTGETPRAFVVPKDIHTLPDEQEILKFVNEQVVEYRQINGGLFLVRSLPKIVVGKINRQLVKKNPEKLDYLRERIRL